MGEGSRDHSRFDNIFLLVFFRSSAGPSSLEIAKIWPVVFQDSFDTSTKRWRTGSVKGEAVQGNTEIANGKFVWTFKAIKNGWYWHVPDAMPDITDFYATIEAKRAGGIGSDAEYGMVFRVSGKKFYAFAVDDNRNVSLQRFDEGKWAILVDWSPTSSIRPYEVNRLTVIAEGSHFSFYINDQFAGDINDDWLQQGVVGPGVYLPNPGDEGIFEFDTFEVRRKP